MSKTKKTSKKSVSKPAVLPATDDLPPSPNDYSWDDDGKRHGLIPPTIGIGIKWIHKDSGHLMETVIGPYDYHNGKRKATLTCSTYVGTMAIGAQHYYATITTNSPQYRDTVTDKSWSGYSGGGPERHFYGLRMEAKRRLTKVEKDLSGEVIGKIGEKTYRFNLPEEAKAAALKMFKERFAPGWVLMGNDEETGDNVIYAET